MKASGVIGSWLIVGGILFLTANSARAQESSMQQSPLGLYVGAGLGPSTIRQKPEAATGDTGLVRGTVGWDAFIGVRPIPYLGAELDYLDFGSTHRYEYTPTPYASNDVSLLHESADAPVAFAVGYLPIQPWWDLYLKAGGARLHRSWDVVPPAICSAPEPCFPPSSFPGHATNWDLAYGVGTQWAFGAMSWRLEYERVKANGSTNAGDPDLLSVGVSWTFL